MKVGHVLTIDDVWMVNLMIFYIEKTIAKALDINDIIKKKYGDVRSMSPNSLNKQSNLTTY